MTYRDMTNVEYQRAYRARHGGSSPADKARQRANTAAAKWVFHNMPELYGNLLAEARSYLGMPTDIGPSGQFTKPIEHGTKKGYDAHRYRNENACPACRSAMAAYYRQRRNTVTRNSDHTQGG
jgi:hypothetical protein